MSKIKIFCMLALMVLIAVPAFAEVQNVKVSGDLSARWILRAAYDLDKNDTGSYGNDTDDYLMSTAEVQVDADLTDNVSTVVRLANQRDWGYPASLRGGSSTTSLDVIVDLANVTLKELVYSPLTVTIGRQDLWFGKGFIVGAQQRDPKASITADEYTVINSFDAIKATLDFDPWKIDGIYSVIEENTVAKADDVWLAGVNVGYKFDSYSGEAEAYAFYKKDRSRVAYVNGATTAACEPNLVSTYGIRGSFEPIANAVVAAEGALQYGRYSTYAGEARKRKASALDISGDYNFKEVKWTPKVGLEYIYYSGEEQTTVAEGSGNAYESWDPMYRGKFDSAIREFQNVYYATALRSTTAATNSLDNDSGVTNEHQFFVIGTMKPIDNLTIDGRYGWFRFDQAPELTGQSSRSKDIGTELDLSLTYAYTEDVSFGLLAAWFFPGKYWLSGQDDTASDIVGTVTVAF
jgi:hypothetical protein